MTNHLPTRVLGEVVSAVERPESPLPAKTYRQIGVQLWGRGAYERETIDGGGTRYKTLSRVEANDIIVNKIWARNGSVAVVPPDLAGCYVSGEFPTFSVDQAQLDPRWFHWFSKTPLLWEQCDEKSRGTSGKNRIRPEKFLEIRIPLPPLAAQRHIVSRIEKLAAKVEEVHGLRRGTAMEADAVTNSALAKIVATLKERVGCKRLGEVIKEAGYGTSRKCDLNRLKDSVPVLRIPNVASERVNIENLKYTHLTEAEMERVLVAPGDVLVVRTNGSIDLVGRSAVVPSLAEKTAFASYLIRIRCNTDVIWPPYFQIMLKHLRTNGNLIDFARTTAGQYNVSLGRLRAAELPVPTLDDQQNVVAYLDDLQAKVMGLKKLQSETATELDALMPSILSKAFRGEL